MAKHGTLGPFSGEAEDWLAHTERLDQYFITNDVTTGAKKRAILLSICRTSTYKLIRSLVSPQKPSEVAYDELIQKVLDYYKPRRSVTFERFKFNTRYRHSDESITKFIAELRLLSEFCDFGDMLDDMIRDRLVCGTNK